MGHPDAVDTPDCRRVGVAGGAPAFPTWAIGVLAGLLAGVWSALRRPRKVE